MKAWLKLAAAVLGGAGFTSIFDLAVDAILEDNDTGAKLDALIREPYQTAGRLLSDARVSTSKAYRYDCLRTSRENFIKAHNLENGFWIFDNGLRQTIQFDRASRIIRASYYAGVCADLLREPPVALRDYENAYSSAMTIEGQLWTARVHNGYSSARGIECALSRRAVLNYFGAWMLQGRKKLDGFALLPLTVADVRDALKSLYEIMQPTADLLYKRGSVLKGLVPGRSLDLSSDDTARRVADRFYAEQCKNWYSK